MAALPSPGSPVPALQFKQSTAEVYNGATAALVQAKASERAKEAAALYRSQEFSASVMEFSKALYLAPNCAAYYAGRARAYRELADFKSAIVDLRAAHKLEPSNEQYRKRLAALLDLQGHMLLQAGAYESARVFFTDAINVDKLVVMFWLHRAAANVLLEEFRGALSDCDHALFLDNSHADAHILRAKLYWHLGMLHSGNKDMHAAVTLQPQHPEVLQFEETRWKIAEEAYQTASAHVLTSNYAAAITQLDKALELAPDDLKSRVLRAACFREMGRFSDSLKDVESASKAFSSQVAEDGAGDMSARSEEDLAEHPEITRQRNLTLNAVALVQHAKGNYAQAITLFNKVVQSESVMAAQHEREIDYRFLVNRGDSYLRLGRLQQALADYHRAFDICPSNVGTKHRLAVVHDQFGVQLFNDGLCAQAEVEFSAAIDFNPTLSVVYLHRGNCEFFMQKIDAALRDYTRAHELDPENAEIRQKLAQFGALNVSVDIMRSLQRRPRKPPTADIAVIRRASSPSRAPPIAKTPLSRTSRPRSSTPASSIPSRTTPRAKSAVPHSPGFPAIR